MRTHNVAAQKGKDREIYGKIPGGGDSESLQKVARTQNLCGTDHRRMRGHRTNVTAQIHKIWGATRLARNQKTQKTQKTRLVSFFQMN